MSTTKAKKAAERVAAKTGSETLVYCGPTIRNICTRFSMFSEAPAALTEKAKQEPLINSLIVPLSAFPEARQQIEQRRGSYYSIYQQIQKNL